jgi:hypothetical protein
MSYEIPSFNPKTKDKEYHVFKNRHGQLICECQAFFFGTARDPNYICKHIRLLQVLEQKQE